MRPPQTRRSWPLPHVGVDVAGDALFLLGGETWGRELGTLDDPEKGLDDPEKGLDDPEKGSQKHPLTDLG
jgi:hypothetical protein